MGEGAGSVEAVVFDAYGTLFDVHSVGALAEELFPGHGARLAAIWRVAQIDYTRIRALSGRYRDFWDITGDALVHAAGTLGLDLAPETKRKLMDQYARLAAFPENHGVLAALREQGYPLAILSNGSPAMLQSAVAAAGMDELLDRVLSVDTVKTFKTAPAAYALAPDAFGCPADRIVFVSSNGWDVCGATWYGFRTFWVNRAGAVLEELGVTPHGEGRSLDDLPAFIAEQAGGTGK